MWNFEVDDIQRVAHVTKAFTNDELDEIIRLGRENLTEGEVVNNGVGKITDYRKSKINFLNPAENTDWLFRKMTDITLTVNQQMFGFDLNSFQEGFQFTQYEAPTGHYDYHVDRLYGKTIRKLTFVLQLTDPSEYEGGELQIYDGGEKEETLGKERGTIWFFPTWTLHRVTPITSGMRNSLVGWVNGPKFR
jgi:PKHD-type hydroxylase